ncbi:MAG: HAMP domain-containing sensor histidine kinase [Gemmatimonadota bacterium]
MTRLSFRTRLFLALFAVSAIPVALISGAGLVYIRTQKLVNGTGNIPDIVRTWTTARKELARVPLSDGAALAVARHDSTLTYVVIASQQKQLLAKNFTEQGPFVFVAAALVLLFGVGVVGVTLSRQFSAPLDEVVDWTDRIGRHAELPDKAEQRAIPEFSALQAALRDLQRGLEQARLVELESERLRAFGEVARRVAHEMKNPLTPIRLAVLQLSRTATPEAREVLDIIAVESSRLEAMAREFAELGRLPEGIAAPVDLQELLVDLLRSAVPESMTHELVANGALPSIEGHYDPLRRAFSNLLRNAVEACEGKGNIAVTLRHVDSQVEVQISDNGPGIAIAKREQIFQPYYTDKGDGTGLGLAIVRQTIEQHHGSIAVTDTPGGGATFLVRFPV